VRIKVDLHARKPEPGGVVRSNSRRGGAGQDLGLHGHKDPEAFAVETDTVRIDLSGKDTRGITHVCYLETPHPYAWIHMKLAAAHDWLAARDTPGSKPHAEKHAFDVYLLVAMLTLPEYDRCLELNKDYRDHPEAIRSRDCIDDLYGRESAPGYVEVRRQAGETPLDYATFWDALQRIVG